MSMVVYRAMGTYSLSIATALALEAFTGVLENGERSPNPACQNYDSLWINIYTVVRNFYNALGSGKREVDIKEFKEALTAELKLIKTLVPIEVVYYAMDYSDLPRLYPHAEFRTENTVKQEQDNHIQETVIKNLLKDEVIDVRILRTKVRPQNEEANHNVAMLTHYPVDLLSAKYFNKLVLLESHTGTLKDSTEWYTKYVNGKELHRMPFNEKLLQVFGDGVMFKPMLKPKKLLVELAEKYKWTPFTTVSKVTHDVNTLRDDWFKTVFKRM